MSPLLLRLMEAIEWADNPYWFYETSGIPVRFMAIFKLNRTIDHSFTLGLTVNLISIKATWDTNMKIPQFES